MVHTQNVDQLVTHRHVRVSGSISEHHRIADRNVFQTRNAQAPWRVLIRSVKIHVPDSAELTQSAELSATRQCVYVQWALSETHFHSAWHNNIPFMSNLLHVCPIHMDRTRYVESRTEPALASACQNTLAIHMMDVDPNVYWTPIVLQILLAFAINAAILVREHVDKTQIAK